MRLLLPLALLLATCAEEAKKPETGPVRRVVSLLPAFTEIVVELGAADRLVGCTPHCRPGRDVTVVGWQGSGAAEEILRWTFLYQPVQAPEGSSEREAEAVAMRGRAGLPAGAPAALRAVGGRSPGGRGDRRAVCRTASRDRGCRRGRR